MAAVNGTLKAIGRSGREYYIDCYLPDAVATVWTFNPSGAAVAGSPAYWIPPEDVVLRDFTVVAGPTATVATFNLGGAVINGALIRYANFLAALPRVGIAIGVPKGSLLGALQA